MLKVLRQSQFIPLRSIKHIKRERLNFWSFGVVNTEERV